MTYLENGNKSNQLSDTLSNGGVELRCDLNSHSNYLCFTIHHRTNDLVIRNDCVTKKQRVSNQDE